MGYLQRLIYYLFYFSCFQRGLSPSASSLSCRSMRNLANYYIYLLPFRAGFFYYILNNLLRYFSAFILALTYYTFITYLYPRALSFSCVTIGITAFGGA
jgi:hypothetical protein